MCSHFIGARNQGGFSLLKLKEVLAKPKRLFCDISCEHLVLHKGRSNVC